MLPLFYTFVRSSVEHGFTERFDHPHRSIYSRLSGSEAGLRSAWRPFMLVDNDGPCLVSSPLALLMRRSRRGNYLCDQIGAEWGFRSRRATRQRHSPAILTRTSGCAPREAATLSGMFLLLEALLCDGGRARQPRQLIVACRSGTAHAAGADHAGASGPGVIGVRR